MARRHHLRALEHTIGRTQMLGGVLEDFGASQPASPHADEEMIERLSLAVSMRDEETGRHIDRMSRYAVALADAAGFTGMTQEDLRHATALHDVGKIGVPDAILLKPAALVRDEFQAMQRHAQIGYRLLAGSSSALLRHAADIALAHHEWWNGSGYPRGLRGDEIPETARIAGVTDVFDALTSNRVYHHALPFDEALAVMTELRGRQFEPRLLDAFVDSLDEITAIRERLPDQEDATERIRVLVVDDHQIFTQSLVRLLASRPELKVVGTAGSVSEAIGAALAYEPDVVLMDFELPDGEGPMATSRIKALCPTAKVIMLTVRNDDESFVRAIAAGCSGFVRKEDSVESLFHAIVAAHDGEMVTLAGSLEPLLRQLRPNPRGLGADLTERELEILGLIAAGHVNKEIAAKLGVRLNTVRNHVQSINHKLEAHSKLEAVATAVRENILPWTSGPQSRS